MAPKPKELIDFSKPMLVLRIGEKVRKPYHKKPFLYVDKSMILTQKSLRKFIQSQSEWDNGTYILKASQNGDGSQGITFFFAQFEMDKGKIKSFPKESPMTKMPFLCWEFFKN